MQNDSKGRNLHTNCHSTSYTCMYNHFYHACSTSAVVKVNSAGVSVLKDIRLPSLVTTCVDMTVVPGCVFLLKQSKPTYSVQAVYPGCNIKSETCL